VSTGLIAPHAIVFLGTLFPVLVNTISGVRTMSAGANNPLVLWPPCLQDMAQQHSGEERVP